MTVMAAAEQAEEEEHESRVLEEILTFGSDDLPFEEELLRNPYSVKMWLRYVEQKRGQTNTAIQLVYERSVRELPSSYKLWHRYLRYRVSQLKDKCIVDPEFEAVNNTFERSLVFMHKMPRIWLDYCETLGRQCKVTHLRHVFDRALRALPVTQHNRIWKLYLSFAKRHQIPELGIRIYRRFVKFDPEAMEDYVDYLLSVEYLDEAAKRLADCINNEYFISRRGKSKHQMWNELCKLLSNNPDKISSLSVEPIIRQGIKRFTNQVGVLWNSLADYYIRAGQFERARDIYEEATRTVLTVRDFSQVFDAYSQFEERIISQEMNDQAEEMDELEMELRLARLELLMERRPLLLNSVLLRQNPHNVHEWHKRVTLFEGKPIEMINTYTEAVQTVDPKMATGKVHTLWVSFAKFYEEHKQLDDAEIIFEKSIQVPYQKVEELANVWCEWAEMKIRHELHDDALKLLRRATAAPKVRAAYFDESESVQNRVYRSLKLWSMYADLEESFGSFKSTRAVYEHMLELRIATPQIIINYGMFLEESNYFEEAFKAYERAVTLFKWPQVYDIWLAYLTKFTDRYGGDKLERARDLFEQALENCPKNFAKEIFLLYASLEENHGLLRNAMAIYDRATKFVPDEEKFDMYNIYVSRAADLFGVAQTRRIYTQAIEDLPDDGARHFCIKFAELERKLGEIDRAREVYKHCAQICDPRVAPDFWQTWKEFEIKHGNEETLREMLRIKRSVQAMFNTQVDFMAAQVSTAEQLVKDALQQAEEQAQLAPTGSGPGVAFVRGSGSGEKAAHETALDNPEEITLGSDDEEDEEEDDVVPGEMQVEQQSVPSAVFGSLKEDEDED